MHHPECGAGDVVIGLVEQIALSRHASAI